MMGFTIKSILRYTTYILIILLLLRYLFFQEDKLTTSSTCSSTTTQKALVSSSSSSSTTTETHTKTQNFSTLILDNTSKTQKNGIDKRKKRIISFRSACRDFPWQEWINSTRANNKNLQHYYVQLFLDTLAHYVTIEPLVPINHTCIPLPIVESANVDCSKYPNAFEISSPARVTPRKVGHLIQLGFDIDILEIHLQEIFEVVDYIFIIEATRSHYSAYSKPLMWERVRSQGRFAKFKNKIVHIILDDIDTVGRGSFWEIETLQEEQRWLKFLEWNDKTKFFGEDDIIGFGDADEISSRENINLLRYCSLKSVSIDIGIYFSFGNVNKLFITDHPVPGHKFSLGDPSFFTIKSALNLPNRTFPNRKRGKSGAFLLGGTHMTYHGYLPYQFVRRLTATETSTPSEDLIVSWRDKLLSQDINIVEQEFATIPSGYNDRVFNVIEKYEEVKDIYKLPWFFNCNRARYPTWEGKHDSRLDISDS